MTFAPLGRRPSAVSFEDCFETNQANFRRILALEGERAPALTLDLLSQG